MNQYPNAGPGLKKMFIGQVGMIVCIVLAIIPLVNFIAGIASLAFAIVSVVGLYQAGKDIEGCRTAFTLQIIEIVMSIVSMFFSKDGTISILFTAADGIIMFFIIYNVCKSVSEVMGYIGANDIAARGERVWKMNLGCYIATVVIAMFTFIPIINVVAAIAGIFVMIVSVVAAILYMLFLNKSYLALGA